MTDGEKSKPRSKPTKAPKPPKATIRYNYALSKILAQRKTIRTAILTEFGNELIVKDRYDRLLDLIVEAVDGELHYDTLWDSARNVVGEIMTRERADELAWRIAGNVRRIQQRKVVPPWHVQRLPELAPMQILACRRSKSTKGVIGATFTFSVLAGTAASLTLLHWWSLKQCRHFAVRLGFSKRLPGNQTVRFPYAAPEQFVTLRLYGLLEPDRSTADGPGFQQIGVSASMLDFNKKILRKRCRVLPKECPEKYEPSFPCHHCARGYQSCPAGTHRRDWIKDHCDSCNMTTFFDPDISKDLCVNCYIKKTYHDRKGGS